MGTIENLISGDLRIDAAVLDEPPSVRLTWHGKSNARQADQLLLPYLERALDHAVTLGGTLELHFERLGHFNSSTIASVIQLIQLAQHRAAKLVVFSDPRRQWQRLSFDALRVFVRPDGLFQLRTADAESDA
jgi:hypothetical protein